MQRVHRRDSEKPPLPQPVKGIQAVHQPDLDQKRIHRAVHPEQLFDPDGADKRRQYQGHQYHRCHHALEREMPPVR